MKTRKFDGLAGTDWLIREVSVSDKGLAKRFAERFGVSRAAASNFIKTNVGNGFLIRTGSSTRPKYALGVNRMLTKSYRINEQLDESLIWANDFLPFLGELKSNVSQICDYGFTEMVNNAKDHSEGDELFVLVFKEEEEITIFVKDDGVGVYQKISDKFNLGDLRLAHFELCKGKLTTDKKNHTGEGIFFTSRSFDIYWLMANGLYFDHQDESELDWLHGFDRTKNEGTTVLMMIHTDSDRDLTEVFNKFTSDDGDFAFDKTVIPVNLVRMGEENLVSRSQAKRLLNRIDAFKFVGLDFKDVNFIGQAFADEIFRVFQNNHPEITFRVMNANDGVKAMINRAKNRTN
jgi:Signal transduction histidine kinase